MYNGPRSHKPNQQLPHHKPNSKVPLTLQVALPRGSYSPGGFAMSSLHTIGRVWGKRKHKGCQSHDLPWSQRAMGLKRMTAEPSGHLSGLALGFRRSTEIDPTATLTALYPGP